jgi:cyclopropane fatty-acyl-phospholipid synthase-like methyltransferase
MQALKKIYAQFGDPRGFGGWLAGRFMLYRASNRARARWAVSLLDVQPGDDVLDIGIGPGYSTQLIAQGLRDGRVVGVDRSKTMVDMTARRLRRFLRAGKATLVRTDVRTLPRFDVSFDRVLAINVAQFWGDDLGSVLELLRERMTPGGRIAIAVQPRHRGATAAAAQLEGSRLTAALEAAGFRRVASSFNASLGRVPGVCVVAHA